MKVRDSGMPDREMWKEYFNTENIITTLGIDRQTDGVAEFGCGYGTFTIPVANVISGVVYAFDIEKEMINSTNKEAKKHGFTNVNAVLRDFIAFGTGLQDGSMDYAMLFNILHLENPVELLEEANRILKPGGKAGIIHWNYDPSTPRGPAMNIRPKPEECIKWAEAAGFCLAKQYDLKPYHYGIVLKKE